MQKIGRIDQGLRIPSEKPSGANESPHSLFTIIQIIGKILEAVLERRPKLKPKKRSLPYIPG